MEFDGERERGDSYGSTIAGRKFHTPRDSSLLLRRDDRVATVGTIGAINEAAA